MGVAVAARGADGQLDRLAQEAKADRVLAGVVAGADGVIADFAVRPRAGELSTFTDLGLQRDVIVDLANGTKLVFAGIGTGQVNSWSDIVLQPSSDLILV